MPPRRRVRALTIAGGIAAVVISVPLLAVHLPFVRRLVAANVNRALASAFVGSVVVDRIGGLSLTHAEGIDAHADDAEGHRVLEIHGARGNVSTWALLRSAFGRTSALVVDIPDLSVAQAEATLEPDDHGVLRIARAFELRPVETPAEPPRPVRVSLPRIELATTVVHIRPNAAPPLDVTVNGALGKVAVGPEGLSIDLDRAPLEVRGLPGHGSTQGNLDAHLTNPVLRIAAHWNGTVDSIAAQADATYEDGHLDAKVDAGRASPEQMRAAWAECPLQAPADAHVEAHGTLPRLAVSAHAQIGSTTIDVSGPLTVIPDVEATLHVEGSDVDAQCFLATTTRSKLAVKGDLSLTARPTGVVEGHANAAIAGEVFGWTRILSATLNADFERSAAGEPSARAELKASLPGAPILLSANLALRNGSPVVSFEGRAAFARLEDVAALGSAVSGSADANTTGTVDFGAGSVDARLTANLANAAVRGVSLGSAKIDAHATGGLVAPSVEIEAEGEDVQAKELHLSSLHAHGVLTGGARPAVHDLTVEAAGEGEPAQVRARLVSAAGDGATAEEVVVEGLGAPLTGALRVSPNELVVKAKSEGIDLARLGTFGDFPLKRGTLSFDVDATIGPGSAQGKITALLQRATWRNIGESTAQLEVALEGRRASGRANANIGDVGTLQIESSAVQVGKGPLLTAGPWRKAWGAVRFATNVDLARLAAHLPASSLPFDDVVGTLQLSGQASRDAADDATPGVEFDAHTAGLSLARRGGWRVDGVDPSVHVGVDGTTGETTIHAQVADAAGAIAILDGHSSSVPYAVLFSDENPVHALRATPFTAHVVVSPRRVESLPPVLGLAGVTGEVRADVAWSGAVDGPTIDVSAGLADSRPDPAIITRPLDLSLTMHYDGARADATLRGSERAKQVLDASVALQARMTDVLAAIADGETVPWTASGRVKVDRLPLQSIAWLDDRQVRGRVSGEASLDGLHANARANLSLDFSGVEVGGVPCRSSKMTLALGGSGLDAAVRLDQDDGFVEGRAHTALRWGNETIPRVDWSQPAQASLSAKGFRAAFLLPVLSKSLTELDGRIDADARVRVEAGAASVKPEGTIVLSDGTFELASFGGEFHGAAAKLVLSPDGVIRLEDAIARGLSGSVRAAASARLDGASLSAMNATIQIPAKDPMPLVLDGVEIGKIDGNFGVTGNRGGPGGEVDVSVDVPVAHIQLPAGQASRDVQSLGELPGVHVGVRQGADSFVSTPLDGRRSEPTQGPRAHAATIQVGVRLGDVQVSRGTDLDVRLEGRPTVTLSDQTRVAGQVRLVRGSIDVDGKPFAIERGTVTFVGSDPTNPQVVLTAAWTAPDSTQIYADFVGPLKTGKVKLRSEPAKTQSEILALILFGTEQGSGTPSGTASQVSPVAAQVGDAATQPLNRALGGVDKALDSLGLAKGISTKVDTSQVNPRPEVEVQIARDISLQIAWVLGVPPPGTNPDSTLVTLDWHFLRKWSLETTVGDAGTSIVDVVWQHRY